jgi:hypothetical protein
MEGIYNYIAEIESKSTYLTFTLRNDPSPPKYLNNVEIPLAATVQSVVAHGQQVELEGSHHQETKTKLPTT